MPTTHTQQHPSLIAEDLFLKLFNLYEVQNSSTPVGIKTWSPHYMLSAINHRSLPSMRKDFNYHSYFSMEELCKIQTHPCIHLSWKNVSKQKINSLRPSHSDAILRHRSGSTLAQVMACCLTAPSHYLNQCWLISTIQLHSPDGNFTRNISVVND